MALTTYWVQTYYDHCGAVSRQSPTPSDDYYYCRGAQGAVRRATTGILFNDYVAHLLACRTALNLLTDQHQCREFMCSRRTASSWWLL